MMAIMSHLLAEPDKSMSEVVYEQYYATLNKWHGFWASSAFNVSVCCAGDGCGVCRSVFGACRHAVSRQPL
jgi:hypothetical protein